MVKDEGRRLSWKGLFEMGEQLAKNNVKEPGSVYEYIMQLVGLEEDGGMGCWPQLGRRSTVF